MKTNDMLKGLLPLLKKYRYILLTAAAGVVLLLLPPIGGRQPTSQAPPSAVRETVDGFSVTALETRLSEALSQVEGAGRVEVVLTVKGSARRVIAQDSATNERDGEWVENLEAVVVNAGSGVQETVLLEECYPQFQGALVVCPGGGDPAVRLKLIEAISALTGLGSDKISICKGK